jgi:hypothetical protein
LIPKEMVIEVIVVVPLDYFCDLLWFQVAMSITRLWIASKVVFLLAPAPTRTGTWNKCNSFVFLKLIKYSCGLYLVVYNYIMARTWFRSIIQNKCLSMYWVFYVII